MKKLCYYALLIIIISCNNKDVSLELDLIKTSNEQLETKCNELLKEIIKDITLEPSNYEKNVMMSLQYLSQEDLFHFDLLDTSDVQLRIDNIISVFESVSLKYDEKWMKNFYDIKGNYKDKKQLEILLSNIYLTNISKNLTEIANHIFYSGTGPHPYDIIDLNIINKNISISEELNIRLDFYRIMNKYKFEEIIIDSHPNAIINDNQIILKKHSKGINEISGLLIYKDYFGSERKIKIYDQYYIEN